MAKVTVIQPPRPVAPPPTIDITGLTPDAADKIMALLGVVCGPNHELDTVYYGIRDALGKPPLTFSSFKVTHKREDVSGIELVKRTKDEQ